MRLASVVLALAAVIALAQNPTPPAGGKAPAKTPAQPALKRTAPAAASYKDLRFPELRPVTNPPVETVTLSNGLRVFLLEEHELPLVNGIAIVRTGTALDPPDKAGLAALAGQNLLEGGTTAKPNESISRRFRNLGADIEGTVSESELKFSFSSLKENSDDALAALKDLLTTPSFSEERLDLTRTRARANIAHRNDDPAAIVNREFIRSLVGKDSPYAAQMEYATLDRINRSDLANFHRRYFFPKNVILALEGDFDAAATKTRLQTLFGDWQSEQPPVPDFPAAGGETTPGKYLAVKKEALAYIAVGELSGDYLDPDFPALQIAADILGGGPRGRLNQKLRAVIDPLSVTWTPGGGHPGMFKISGSFNPFQTIRVLQTIFQELTALREAEVSDAELKAAKDAAVNSYVFAFDNQLSILPRVAESEYLNLPKDYIQRHQAALAAVTRADVLRVAKGRLDPAKMTAVVVGNPTSFENTLDKVGGPPAVTIDLTIPADKTEAAIGDAASLRQGRELLARIQQASGGAEKLAAVKDYVQEMAYQFDASAGGAQATSTERWVAPGFLRQDNVFPSGKISVYCDGKAGWVVNPLAYSLLGGISLQQMQSDLFRIYFPLLLSDRTAGRKLNALDENTLEISDGTQVAKLVIDPATGLVQKVMYNVVTETGPAAVIDTYSDFRDVAGVKVPFKVAITVGGKKFQEVVVKNFQVNAGLKVQDLERRQ